jgi:hypothetical protein
LHDAVLASISSEPIEILTNPSRDFYSSVSKIDGRDAAGSRDVTSADAMGARRRGHRPSIDRLWEMSQGPGSGGEQLGVEGCPTPENPGDAAEPIPWA